MLDAKQLFEPEVTLVEDEKSMGNGDSQFPLTNHGQSMLLSNFQLQLLEGLYVIHLPAQFPKSAVHDDPCSSSLPLCVNVRTFGNRSHEASQEKVERHVREMAFSVRNRGSTITTSNRRLSAAPIKQSYPISPYVRFSAPTPSQNPIEDTLAFPLHFSFLLKIYYPDSC
jgi:hypothetical protein